MKYDKINQEVLKRLLKEQPVKYDISEDGMWYYIFMEGNVGIWKIHKYLWYLNLEADGPHMTYVSRVPNAEKKIFEPANNLDNMVGLVDKGEYESIPASNGKKQYLIKIFRTPDNTPIYINPDLIAHFDATNARYFGKDSKSPVYVFEGADCVGVVLPVNRG